MKLPKADEELSENYLYHNVSAIYSILKWTLDQLTIQYRIS